MWYNSSLQILFCILFVAVSSCGTISVQGEEQPSRIVEDGIIGRWKLRSINKVDYSKLENTYETQNTMKYITLNIEADASVNGFWGCNSFSGNIKYDDSEIQFNKLKSTSKMCYGAKIDIEKIISDILHDANNYYIKDNILYLRFNKEVLAIYIAVN